MSPVETCLNLRVRRELKAVPDADYSLLVSEAAAVKYACEHSGLQDKSIAIDIGTDGGTLSKAKAGQARLGDDSLDALMDTTGCEAPLLAWLLRRGYDPHCLRRFESDVERENRELREQVETMQREREIEQRTVRELLGPGRA